jgi:hypothetical protein
MIGVAVELELADFINAGPKTADEIAKAKGLHPTPLYRLLRGLASYRIWGYTREAAIRPNKHHRTGNDRIACSYSPEMSAIAKKQTSDKSYPLRPSSPGPAVIAILG